VQAYQELMQLEREFRCNWDERDVMVYALGLGLPSDPLDERQLAYVYEKDLAVLPTFLSSLVLGQTAIAFAGLEYARVLHGEQQVKVHSPIPTRGEALVRSRLLGAWDKGKDKGAVFTDVSNLYLEGDEQPFATVLNTAFGRAEGGFGGPKEGQPSPHPIPSRNPDRTVVISTLRQQALLYRQSGDLNPLHVDPAAARAVGFPEPILHGLCTFGICQRAVLGEFADFAPDSLEEIGVRFVNVVFPGESIRIDMWQDGSVISFEAFVEKRQAKVIGNGKAVLR
jgi:acyl dehydratase